MLGRAGHTRRWRTRTIASTALGTAVLLVCPLVLSAQQPGALRLVLRGGVAYSQSGLERVPQGESGTFEGDVLGTGIAFGLSARKAFGSDGWSIEAGWLWSGAMTVPSSYRCAAACLLVFESPDLSVSATSFFAALITPSPRGLPVYARFGVGVERLAVSWPSGTNFRSGGTSDLEPMLFGGIGSRWSIHTSQLEVELSTSGSWPDFDMSAGLATRSSLTFGIVFPAGERGRSRK